MNLQELINLNQKFHKKFGIKDSDLEYTNYFIGEIKISRSKKEPRPGDRIRCWGSNGIVHEKAHMDSPIHNQFATICIEPYVPFVSMRENGLFFETSGGYWIAEEEPEMFVYKDKVVKQFCFFGSAGMVGSGAIHFKAKVNLWELFREDIY